MKSDETPTGEYGPPRVLVVDDEATIRDVLIDFLELEEFDVRAVPSAEEALEQLDEFGPDVVLLDLEMPGMNGLQLLRELERRVPHIVSVMMTGYGTVETAIEAMKSGADDFVLKPFKVPDVIGIIERCLEKKRLQAENVQLKELVDLYDASEKVGARLKTDHIYDVLVDSMGTRSGAHAVSLWRCDGQEGNCRQVRRWIDEEAPAQTEAVLDELITRDFVERFVGAVARIVGPDDLDEPIEQPFSLLSMPLRADGDVFGAVLVLRLPPRKPFRESKRKLLSILTDRAAAAIENARLYQDLQNTFKQTIQALANILEDRDPYTRGHSDRVSKYARMIAVGMGLSDEMVERIADSALMHDIGKLGIRFEELNKADPLTESEYEMFKSHTTRGKWILEPIEFLHPLIPGVYHHHERWDGRGYPQGLNGEETPLMARILAVADTYDAMTSHRAYRRALPHEVAMREIQNCAGTQFDPDVVEVFVREMNKHRSDHTSRAERWRALDEEGMTDREASA